MVKRKVTKRKRKVTKRKRKVTKRKRKITKRKFGLGAALKLAEKAGGALQKGAEIKKLMEVKPEPHYVGALKKIDEVKGGKTIEKGIGALKGQLVAIGGLQEMPPVFNDFMKPVLEGLKIDLDGVKGFATTKAKIEATKEKLKAMTVVDVKGLTGQYDKIKTKIMGIESLKKDTNIQEMQKIINTFTVPGFNLQDKLRGSLPSALLLFLIDPKSTPATNKALATFTAEKITAAKAVATTPQGSFGRRKRKRKVKRKKVSKKLPAALKRMCKKYKVRLTVKRNGKRVYKSEKVLKKQCKNALKRRKK